MLFYDTLYQQHVLAEHLAVGGHGHQVSTQLQRDRTEGDTMDHHNFHFYLVMRDIRRQSRGDAADPLWSVPEHGRRLAGQSVAAVRRPFGTVLHGIGRLRPRLRARHQPTTPE